VIAVGREHGRRVSVSRAASILFSLSLEIDQAASQIVGTLEADEDFGRKT